MHKLLLMTLLLLLFLDQILKYLLRFLWPEMITVNSALAFGFDFEAPLLWIGLVLLGVVLFLTKAQPRVVWVVLLIATAFNLLDRLFVGGVIDYLSLGPLRLNLTDIVICFLCGWLVYPLVTQKDA